MFVCQNGPGAENAFGGIAQCYAESVPLVFMPGGMARAQMNYFPNFSSQLNYQHITKSAEVLTNPADIWNALRRAFSLARTGRPGPCLLEIPSDLYGAKSTPFDYQPVKIRRSGPDPRDVDEAGRACSTPSAPIIYAGQGVHYAQAWAELKALAELLEIPVTTALEGKSSFPENHPLSLGSGGAANPDTGVPAPAGRGRDLRRRLQLRQDRLRHPVPDRGQDLHPLDAGRQRHRQGRPDQHGIVGDAKLTLQALYDAVERAARRQAARPMEARRLADQDAEGASGCSSGCPSSRRTTRRSRPTA